MERITKNQDWLKQALLNVNIQFHSTNKISTITHENIFKFFSIIEQTYELASTDKLLAITLENNLESALLILYAFTNGKQILALDPSESIDFREKKLSLFPRHVAINPRLLDLNSVDLSKISLKSQSVGFDYDELFLITFTSGSTGTPKAVLHNRKTLVECAFSFSDIFECGVKKVFGNFMPLHYMAGIFNGLLVPFINASNVVIFEQFDIRVATKFNKLVLDCKISDAWLSPSMISMICLLDRTRENIPPHCFMNAFICTGPSSEHECRKFKLLYDVNPIIGYGLSETLFVSFTNVSNNDFNNVGFALPGVDLTLKMDGTLLISGPHVAIGYMDGDGITFFNGQFLALDRMHLRDDGTLVFKGRTDDVIVRSGINIDPYELENFLREKIDIGNFCLVGVSDDLLGSKLVMVFENEDKGMESIIQKLIAGKSNKIKIDTFLYDIDLPKTATGKIKRAKLVEIINYDL